MEVRKWCEREFHEVILEGDEVTNSRFRLIDLQLPTVKGNRVSVNEGWVDGYSWEGKRVGDEDDWGNIIRARYLNPLWEQQPIVSIDRVVDFRGIDLVRPACRGIESLNEDLIDISISLYGMGLNTGGCIKKFEFD